MLNALIAFVRHHLLTRENAWAVAVCLMLILIYLAWTMGAQPPFLYGGF